MLSNFSKYISWHRSFNCLVHKVQFFHLKMIGHLHSLSIKGIYYVWEDHVAILLMPAMQACFEQPKSCGKMESKKDIPFIFPLHHVFSLYIERVNGEFVYKLKSRRNLLSLKWSGLHTFTVYHAGLISTATKICWEDGEQEIYLFSYSSHYIFPISRESLFKSLYQNNNWNECKLKESKILPDFFKSKWFSSTTFCWPKRF